MGSPAVVLDQAVAELTCLNWLKDGHEPSESCLRRCARARKWKPHPKAILRTSHVHFEEPSLENVLPDQQP